MQVPKVIYLVIVAIIILMIGYVYRLQASKEAWPEGLRLEELPFTIGEWQADKEKEEFKVDYYNEDRQGQAVGTQHIIREYSDNKGNSLGLYVGYFNYRKGSEHHNPDTCFPSLGWQILNREVVTFGDPPQKAISMQVTKGLNRQEVFFWFQTEEGTMVNKLKHQLYLIKESLFNNRANGIVVRLTARIKDGSSDEILALQKEFAQEVFNILPDYIP